MHPNPPKRVLLLTHARTASHLLERMLSGQPNTAYASHPFVTALTLFTKSVYQGDSDSGTRDELLRVWQEAFTSSWEPFFAKAAEDGKIAFMHTHPYFSLQPALSASYARGQDNAGGREALVLKSAAGESKHSEDNPEVLPDMELLAPGTVPILTIRHPALMVPSIYRTIKEAGFEIQSDETMAFNCTLHWQRLLYDFYAKHGPEHGIEPVVVDADDYQGPDYKAFMARLCDAVGLDKQSLLYSWPKASQDDLNAIPGIVAEIKKTILGSDKVIGGLDSKSRDLKADEAKWADMFGEEGAGHVRAFVEKAMADYEYLRERRFK